MFCERNRWIHEAILESLVFHTIICSYFMYVVLMLYLCDCVVLQVDDGFWEGELKGRIGAFPSLVVEVVYDEGEEEEEEVKLAVCFPK